MSLLQVSILSIRIFETDLMNQLSFRSFREFDLAGVVVEMGTDVEDSEEGNHVFGTGLDGTD